MGFATVGRGHACRRAGVTLATYCRLDIALYNTPAPKEGSLDERESKVR